MAMYKYSAVSRNGKRVSGVIDGFNELDAVAKIKATHPVVLQITEVKDKGGMSAFLSLEIGGNKLNDKAFTLMCSQFSVILKAGIPINRTVVLIAEKMTDKPLKRILEQVAKDVGPGGRCRPASRSAAGSCCPSRSWRWCTPARRPARWIPPSNRPASTFPSRTR